MQGREGPSRVGEVIGRMLCRRGITQLTARALLENGWRSAVGTELSERTKVGALRRGVLEILVDSPILLQELDGYRKDELLGRLQAALPAKPIAALRFRRM